MGAVDSAAADVEVLGVSLSGAYLHLTQLQSYCVLRQVPDRLLTCTCQVPWPLPC